MWTPEAKRERPLLRKTGVVFFLKSSNPTSPQDSELYVYAPRQGQLVAFLNGRCRPEGGNNSGRLLAPGWWWGPSPSGSPARASGAQLPTTGSSRCHVSTHDAFLQPPTPQPGPKPSPSRQGSPHLDFIEDAAGLQRLHEEVPQLCVFLGRRRHLASP